MQMNAGIFAKGTRIAVIGLGEEMRKGKIVYCSMARVLLLGRKKDPFQVTHLLIETCDIETVLAIH